MELNPRDFGVTRLGSSFRDTTYFPEVGFPFLSGHLTYTGQLEDYISRYKRRPPDIKYWPYGPYWPRDFDGLLLNTPRHKWAECEPDEDSRLAMGDYRKALNEVSRTIDNQLTPYKGRWRGIQVTYDCERSPRDFSTLPVPEGCCPSLMFESRFECGNLRQARRIGQYEYELVLKSDLYTARHTQWYYFRITNVVPGITYKLRIVNLLKKDSLYNHGMRPLLYSEKDAQEKQRGWVRTGHHISYSRNMTNHNSPLLQRGVPYHMLEWQMEFPNADDTYYVAHCYPYSFTDLKEDLEVLMNSEERSKVTEREVMCETRAGNSCFLLTVTNFDVKEGKKAVVITARVHPGESQASWMMKGLLEFITGPDTEAQELRDRFIFKIIPMINPDGVIVGNYRCSLAARDLNRNYRHPRRESFPTVWYLKNMVDDLARKYEISLYCDLHGHSRKPNVFMYGNNTSSEGDQSAIGMARAFISERLFPWLMAERSPDKFSFKSCKFNIRKCKESTGRVVMWRQMRIFNSFTLETTFSGTVIDENKCRHFNILDLMEMGKTLAQTVLDYDNVQENQAEQTQVVLDLTRVITEQILVSKGLIDRDCKLPDFTVDKEIMETDSAKVQESAEKWTGALLELLNAPTREPTPAKQPEENKGVADTTGTEEEQSRPVYTRDDVILMLGKLTGRDARNMEDCLGLLAQMDVQDNFEESDSSDSDSESEPEMKPPEPKVRKKKRKSKKQRDHDKKSSSNHDKKHSEEGRIKALSKNPIRHRSLPDIGQTGSDNVSALATVGASHRTGGSNSANSVNSLPANSGKQATSDKYRNGSHSSKQVTGYISKYEGRHNGGVPCFTEERSMERAAKRLAELRKKSEDERNNKELTFYCVDDNGLHPFSQEDLRLKLEALAEASGASPTHLMGLNVRTGYTHADNLQELSPSPHQPLNNVNSFVLSTLSNPHSRHNMPFTDFQDHSSSEESDSEENLEDPEINPTMATTTNSSPTTTTTSTTTSHNKENVSMFVTPSTTTTTDNNNNNNNSNGNNILSSTGNNTDNINLVSNRLGRNSSFSTITHTGTIITNTVTISTSSSPSVAEAPAPPPLLQTPMITTTPTASQFIGYPFPVTARRNPYHHLDPLEQRSVSTVASVTPRHHHHPHHKHQHHQQRRSNFPPNQNHSRPSHLHQYFPSTSHNKSSSPIASFSHPSSSSTIIINPAIAAKSEPILQMTNLGDGFSYSSKKGANGDTNIKTGHVTLKRGELKRENSNAHNNFKDIRNLKRANTTLSGKNSSLLGNQGANNYNNNSTTTQTFFTQGLINRGETFVYDVLTTKEIPKTVQKPPQNVGQMVQQLADNLTGVISPSPVSKRFVSYNRNSPFRGMSKITPHSLSPSASPLITSTMIPANRTFLPDHMSAQRVDDKTRLGGRSSSTMIRSLNSPRHEFSWE